MHPRGCSHAGANALGVNVGKGEIGNWEVGEINIIIFVAVNFLDLNIDHLAFLRLFST